MNACTHTRTYTPHLDWPFFLPKIFTNFLAVIHSAEDLYYTFTEDKMFMFVTYNQDFTMLCVLCFSRHHLLRVTESLKNTFFPTVEHKNNCRTIIKFN